MKPFIEKLLAFLRVRETAGGLEVSDEVVRFAHFDGKLWRLDAVRLEPGVLVGGVMKDRARFVACLAALRIKVRPKKKAAVNVVLCFGSLPAYTQVFSLPAVAGKGFDEAVELNLKMASPLEKGESYSGWQVVGRDERTLQTEVLSAFMARGPVDEMVSALFDAGFIVMAAESKALALTRVLREKGAGVDVARPYIFVSIDNSGLTFLVIRNGSLYFEYAEPWHDLMDGRGEINVGAFKEALAASTRQVVNFYRQHWQDPLAAIILSAAALDGEAGEAIVSATSAPLVRLTLIMGQMISPEWLASLGSSLRGQELKVKGQEINLLGEESQDWYRESQAISFLQFWRIAVPVALGLLVAAFVVSDVFLSNTDKAIESRSDFNVGAAQTAEVASLESSSGDFNRMVALVAAAEGSVRPKSGLFATIESAAAASGITVNHVTFQAINTPVVLSGTAASEGSVVTFKTALAADKNISGIDLPLTGIQSNGSGVSFSMTFVYSPPSSGSSAGQ